VLNASTSDGAELVRYTCGTGTNQALDGGRRGHPGSFPSERHSDQQAWGTTLTSWPLSKGNGGF